MMEDLELISDMGINGADKFIDTGGFFDVAKENIHGIFDNLTLLSMLLMSVTKNKNFLKLRSNFNDEYDYIIVGAGSAGSVMANRLSQKPCVSVLLLEAGGEPPLLTEIPSFSRLLYGTQIDWEYKTTPQKHCAFGQKENKIIWNAGKALGGTSSLNAMLYVRGNRKNYDDWGSEGATGWSYKDVLHYFKKLEDNRNIKRVDRGFHRKGGPLTVEKVRYTPEIKYPILEATQGMGYEQVDINGRRQTGIYDVQATVRDQQRCSSAKAYLEPARNRENLDILTHAFARKILIGKSKVKGDRIAYGVEFDYNGKTHTVKARKEIIIASGSIRTPQILMLSGIGPREELRKWNISVVSDLPVGRNLQDHYASHLVYTVKDSISPVVVKNLNPVNILDYIANRRGPLAAPSQITLLAFLDGLNTTAHSRDFPRQELFFAEYSVVDAKLNSNIKDELFTKVYAPYLLKPLYICFSSLLQPYSRGEITLKSADPHDVPNINPNYYEDKRDLESVVEGMKICDEIAKQPAMRKVQADLIETQKTGYPACEKYEGNRDDYFGCIAKQVVTSFWHSVGTARMGQKGDPRSVVDPQLRVIGVRKLRVVNAAVMPTVPSGNINVPTMMVAEKAYDMMKDDVICRGKKQMSRRKVKRCHSRSHCN